MSQFSRVKKNQELYKRINEEDKTEIIESSLRDYERRTAKRESTESKYQASRYRKFQPQTETDTLSEDKPKVEVEETFSQKEILRDRNLLEEFIEEVKHYNINRGLRNVQDTQMNILQNLQQSPKKQAVQEEITNTPVEEVVESEEVNIDDPQDLTQEIQAIIANLDEDFAQIEEAASEDFTFEPLDEENDQKLSSIFDEISENSQVDEEKEKAVFVKGQEEGNTQDVDEKHKNTRDYKSNELLELTQTLSLQLDLQDEEKPAISPQVSVLDRVISILIIILIMAAVAIIIYGIYWVSKERGFI